VLKYETYRGYVYCFFLELIILLSDRVVFKCVYDLLPKEYSYIIKEYSYIIKEYSYIIK